MTKTEIKALRKNTLYFVRIRHSQMEPRTGKMTHRTGRRVRRYFLGIEEARPPFGLACANFTTRVQRGRNQWEYLSVPHYDLIEATPIHKTSKGKA